MSHDAPQGAAAPTKLVIRNIGLMLAATGFAVPDVAWLYVALAQFRFIYCRIC